MTYLRYVLSGIAALFAVLIGPGLLRTFKASYAEKATGLAVVSSGLIEAIHSPRFWFLTVFFLFLFLAASRLHNKALRFLFFWTPVVAVSLVGFGVSGLIAWLYYRNR